MRTRRKSQKTCQSKVKFKLQNIEDALKELVFEGMQAVGNDRRYLPWYLRRNINLALHPILIQTGTRSL